MVDLRKEGEKIVLEFTKDVAEYIKANAQKLQYNENIFEIREGDLLKQLLVELDKQMSGDSAKIASQRAAPINVLNKIVTKTSTLYKEPPVRKSGSDKNDELIAHYVGEGVNVTWQDANEAFSSYKWTAIELFEDQELGKLRSRVVPSHLFLAKSDSRIDPLRPTAIAKAMGTVDTKDASGKTIEKDKYWVYTEDMFIPIDEDGDIVQDDMLVDPDTNTQTFENDFGIIPFTYISKSRYLLVPIVDSDTLQMTLLIPVLITDMNFASMFLSMPILYGIDIDAQNMKLSANNFWNLSSKESSTGEAKPQIGVIKAEPNLEAQMNNVVEQFRLWVYTKDVTPGAVGRLSAENFASGIAKVIAEMDTADNSTKQESYFKFAERDFWRRLGIMHNHLVEAGRIDKTLGMFEDPENMIVNVEYSDVVVFQTRKELIEEQKLERDAGYATIEKGVRKLNPDAGEDEIKKLLLELKADQTIERDDPNGFEASEDQTQDT